ncbi:unnamed protein product, partial [Hapterophycus canaliculatus]
CRCPLRRRRRQEATKFKSAMADPEFQAMLRDYMEEMQDPAQRAVSESFGSKTTKIKRLATDAWVTLCVCF